MTTPAVSTRIRPARVLLIGLWFGLLTGFIEDVLLAIRSYGLGHLVHVSWQFPWMVPVADAMIFLVPALLLTLADMVFPKLVPFRVALFVFLGMTCAAFLFLFTQVSTYALAILAVGLGFQLSRIVSRQRTGLERLVVRTTPWMLGMVLLLAGGMFGWSRWSERRAAARLAAAPAGAPNVLLIILDTVRAANLSLYGYGRETTPNLKRFATEGVRFDQAFSAAPWTLPSHASLVTGRWPHELTADWLSPLDGTYPTIAEYFTRHGYVTGGFVANVGYVAREFGMARGFNHYQDYPATLATILQSSSIGQKIDRSQQLRKLVRSDQHMVRVAAPTINDGLLGWVDHRGQRPFFAMLNYYDAHGPYLPPAPYDRMFDPRGRPNNYSPLHRFISRPNQSGLAAPIMAREMAQYDGALAYLDHELGDLFAELERRGILQNTIVIVTADHGEEFGEHGVYDHGNSLYRPAVHVPLLIVAPGHAPSETSVGNAVTLRDVAHTLVDLATPGEENPFPGMSLRRFWTDSVPVEDPILSELSKGIRTPKWYPVSKGDMKSVVAESLRYIRNGDGQEEMYGLFSDQWEAQNLVKTDSLTA
ncbi:MAG: sulfatase, partial [Gemmatimonadota bacterium]